MQLKKLTPGERARRKKTCRESTEKKRENRRKGLCSCGRPRSSKTKKNGNSYRMCDRCLDQYKNPPGRRQAKKVVIDRSLRDDVGLHRRKERDGLGRVDWWWVATVFVDKTNWSTRFSVAKHGDAGARALAKLQRDEWRIMRDLRITQRETKKNK